MGSSLIKGFFGMSRAMWEGLFSSSEADCISKMLKLLCVGCDVCVFFFLMSSCNCTPAGISKSREDLFGGCGVSHGVPPKRGSSQSKNA